MFWDIFLGVVGAVTRFVFALRFTPWLYVAVVLAAMAAYAELR